MKYWHLLMLIWVFLPSFAQESINKDTLLTNGIPIYQGEIKIEKEGRKFSFAFAQGDKISLKISTEKNKNLEDVVFGSALNISFHKEKISTINEEMTIPSDDVYTLIIKGKKVVSLDIRRKPGNKATCNPAWEKVNSYQEEVVNYSVDSAVGYNPPIISLVNMRVFNKYYYQNVSLGKYQDQVKGNVTPDGNDVKVLSLGTCGSTLHGARLKCYTYSLNAVLGGQKHWEIAELAANIGGSAAGIFLSPAAAFAIHGSMALIGPPPNKAPVMYYMTNDPNDISTLREIKNISNRAKKTYNQISNTITSGLGINNKTAANIKTEGDMHFTQKGNVTNLFVSSALPPSEKYFLMTNSYLAHAKNVKFNATAFFYAPSFYNVQAEEAYYQLKMVQLQKRDIKVNKTSIFQSIGE